MKKIAMYFHGGSGNHGCEAIVRSTCKLLSENELYLYSFNKEQDLLYGIEDLVTVLQDKREIDEHSFEYYLYKTKYKLFKNDNLYYKMQHKHIYNKKNQFSYALSIGGDNYCYNGFPDKLAEYNNNFNKIGVKTILWGCSIEPNLFKNINILNDLHKYSLIYARESITYQALCENGFKDKSILYPDPAFILESEKVVLPLNFGENGIVGINVSPLVKKNGKNQNIVIDNYCSLIDWILNNTFMSVILIPHVVWEESDDREILEYIYSKFNYNPRILIIDDQNCMRLKGYISKCRFFVGARTHSTIAAYSSNIPTLVMGYSVKAKGIAKDLFGTYENLVLPVQELDSNKILTDAFKLLMKNEIEIQNKLKEKNVEYKKKLRKLHGLFLE